jgi:hypothetical protein
METSRSMCGQCRGNNGYSVTGNQSTTSQFTIRGRSLLDVQWYTPTDDVQQGYSHQKFVESLRSSNVIQHQDRGVQAAV